MQLYFIRILSMIAIALVYMLYDVFNKRNVPSVFAYATLAYGFLLTILYFDTRTILVSAATALVILGGGYIVYRIGQLGAADVIEFAAISLILPIQKFSLLLSSTSQLYLPFALSLAINTGIIAIIIVPMYYIPKAGKNLKKPLISFVTKKNAFMALLIAVAYTIFISFITLVIGINYVGAIILALMLVSSFFVMLFSTPITYAMINYVDVGQFDEGDIIAVNLMTKQQLASIKKRIKGFDRLLTESVIKQMKLKKIKDKFPVYKEAMPFALPIFAAVVITLLFGNLLLFILGI